MRRSVPALSLILFSASAAPATTYFPADMTISTAINDSADVGHDAAGANTSPTVTLSNSGSITGDLALYNASRFDDNGTLGHDVLLFGTSRFESRSTAQAIAGRMFIRGSSDATIASTVNGDVSIEHDGKLLLGPTGFIGGNLSVYGNGKATITSGRVRGTVIGNVTQGAPPPPIDVFGGVIEQGFAEVAVATNGSPTRGSIGPQIVFHGNSDLFYETETRNGTDPAYPGRSMQLHFVSGTLADGTVLHFLPVKIENGTGAQIVIVPEPTTFIASLAALGLVRRRARR